ncbi:phage head-tail adapter protein [Staphylococcus gallinarum]|uniref:head-tail connector protein n=1 Tax=Staphylococcus gallinarum TaxID=1293 RepID=UPI000D1DC1F1|nr:head-tail connector protein [Staphylococcus gallinarum]PTL18500.1 phage head-tail adapter protein [Staphylococcus gallinarum]RIO80043.1 phage gp6-like head-tail connector protein [Staphylococcus gallinarum]RIO87704.1 phage gp6-like head-tail connector protein [Staphylococcus gallinarum]
MTLEQLKLHMHVTHSMEDPLIEMYMRWAESEIKDSVYPDDDTRNEEFFKDNSIFERGVFLLTSHYFQNRYAYSDIDYHDVPDGVLGTIQKLRGAYPYES